MIFSFEKRLFSDFIIPVCPIQGTPKERVVMLSAMSQEDNVRLALQLGADAFVVKPFQESSLIERIG
mgnify:CR=1 FL=1